MFIISIKRLIAVIFICSSALVAHAQQDHFVYLQTENGQPFYVKFNNKVISSSSAGYIILPKLTDGYYKLNLGFPKNEFPEESFQIAVNNENEGYLVKNFGEKGWGLFNIESFDVVMGGTGNKTETVSGKLQDDPFSKMLATVVKDSSILQKNEPVAEVHDSVKIDSAVSVSAAFTPTVTSDTTASKGDTTASKSLEENPVSLLPATKLLSKKDKDGMQMIYVDPGPNGNDTVRIFMPAKNQVSKQRDAMAIQDTMTAKDTTKLENTIINNDVVHEENPAPPPTKATSASVAPSSEGATQANDSSTMSSPVFIQDISSKKNEDSTHQKIKELIQPSAVETNIAKEESKIDSSGTQYSSIKPDSVHETTRQDNSTQDQMVVLPKVVKSSRVNSDCKAFADNEDFLKLRKKMASENSDNNMIKVARKIFNSKCFSTEQIKNLSFLFLTNEGKYKFFDEAYQFASDSDQYYTLQSQLTDSYYLNRFKAMIRK